METTNLEAFKNNKIRPTKDGLKDSKRPGEDCDVMIGMTCPNAFELSSYMKYDITKLRDSLKILEIVLNRNGRANIICPLYHDGAINYYTELPLPEIIESSRVWPNPELNNVYTYVMKKRAEINSNSAPAFTMLAWAKSKFNNLIK